jgi:hypothetical protein
MYCKKHIARGNRRSNVEMCLNTDTMIDGICFDGTAATETDDTIADCASGNTLDKS